VALYGLSEADLREYCRRVMESLELWLRRLIDDVLTPTYGADYLNAQDDYGNYIINREVRENVAQRKRQEPQRYPRLIDAALLDDEIKILCHQELYGYFRAALEGAFPDGMTEARTFLTRLVEPRNRLSHANPISVRQAERVICYSNDVIDSLKEYYGAVGRAAEYNVPSVIRTVDSFGNVALPRQQNNPEIFDYTKNQAYWLRPGQTISVEVEIDPAFSPGQYAIVWEWDSARLKDRNKVTILIERSHVSELFIIECKVVSNEDWHKHRYYDHRVVFMYRILPPLEGAAPTRSTSP